METIKLKSRGYIRECLVIESESQIEGDYYKFDSIYDKQTQKQYTLFNGWDKKEGNILFALAQ